MNLDPTAEGVLDHLITTFSLGEDESVLRVNSTRGNNSLRRAKMIMQKSSRS